MKDPEAVALELADVAAELRACAVLVSKNEAQARELYALYEQGRALSGEINAFLRGPGPHDALTPSTYAAAMGAWVDARELADYVYFLHSGGTRTVFQSLDRRDVPGAAL